MRRFFLLVILLFGLNYLWNSFGDEMGIGAIAEDLNIDGDNIELSELLNDVYIGIAGSIGFLEEKVEELAEEQMPSEKEVPSPDLESPSNQVFSIYNIELGESKTDIDNMLGAPKRSEMNEYGTEWHTYHENYHNFVKVMYNDQQQVIGLYTNQDLISSTNGIKLNSSKQTVRDTLGQPLTRLQKGLVFYQLQEDSDYDMYELDDTYVTVFYDVHEENTVTAIQLLTEEVENNKKSIYSEPSEALKEGFELQMFDLVNATRVNHELQVLSWDEHVMQTARKHSSDMAVNNYFDHTNLQGESPFDRMEEDGIRYTLAGENLAYGQFSSIFAHEGLMNSLGHRKNIIKSGFEYLGVGVAFNEEAQPYYTQNYYAN
ncbi:CAP domain-containing protein [Bacillus sp. Y1]|nr:CAP domain-containing protein [Bacillus sp. Y1]